MDNYEKYFCHIELLRIHEKFHFMTGQKELWQLFNKAKLMIRPTYSDGYPLSVAEALFLGCTSIASVVCECANGTILFKIETKKTFLLIFARSLKNNRLDTRVSVKDLLYEKSLFLK